MNARAVSIIMMQRIVAGTFDEIGKFEAGIIAATNVERYQST
jgi:hypothetical protein